MALPRVGNFFEALLVSITGALVTLLSFIPALIGALLILIIGWIIAGFVAKLVVALLDKVGFERAAQRTGVTGFMGQAGVRNPRASMVVGELVKWGIRLIFLEAAANALQLTALTELLNRVILWIPNLIVALLVLMVGMLVARFLADLVRGAASSSGIGNPNILATIAQYAVIGFAVLIAVNQVGIAASLVNTLFMGLVGAIALALGLAFGLGGRETASRMWQSWYSQGQQVSRQVSDRASSSPQMEARGASSEVTAPRTTAAYRTDR